MDRFIYLSMTGASQTLLKQASVAHNLANVNTLGFRAERNALRAAPVFGDGMPTRAFVVDSTPGVDFSPGPIRNTGRDLDVAVKGPGWIAIQLPDGSEGYTRAGSLQVSPNGILQTSAGFDVSGEGGPISVPPDTAITVAVDGTVSGVPNGTTRNAVNVLGRIKLVNPPEQDLKRGDDGLFRLKGGEPATADETVRVSPASLEESNVNVVEEMVNMIALARQFDLQVRMMQNAESNARQASQLLNVNR